MTRTYTVAELAERVGGEVRGDDTVQIAGVESIAAATPEHITWLGDTKRGSRLASSRAGAVLVPRDHGRTPMTAIVCDSVDRAVSVVLQLFAPPVPRPKTGVHSTAVVAPTAVLGRDVAIGPHVVIEEGTTIGDRTVLYGGVQIGEQTAVGTDCVLWNHVVVRERCTIGDRVILHPNVVVGSDGFGYFFAGGRHNKIVHGGRVVLGDDVEIGSGSCVDRSKVGVTYVGAGTKIDNLVQVGHNVRIGEHCLIVALSGIGGSTVLGHGVVLGGRVALRDNIVLGDGVQVAACSGVSRDMPAGAVISGVPAVDHRQHMREHAALRKLPEFTAQVRALIKRIETLEAAANDREDRRD